MNVKDQALKAAKAISDLARAGGNIEDVAKALEILIQAAMRIPHSVKPGQLTSWDLAESVEQTKKINDLRTAMRKAKDALVELNLGNYNDDDVREEQNGMLAAWQILADVLDRQEPSDKFHAEASEAKECHEGCSAYPKCLHCHACYFPSMAGNRHDVATGSTSGTRDGVCTCPAPVQPAPSEEEDNERLCSAIDETIIYDNIFKCWHIDRPKFAALRAKLAGRTKE